MTEPLEGFCAGCGKVVRFGEDPYSGEPVSSCCGAPPVTLSLVP